MIADRYRVLLEHLGPTVPVTALRGAVASDVIGLRHDIDHDLGVALDMSAMERDLGDRRATYFILHTHPYCDDDVFLDRLRQLADDGHEIGLHLDALGAWWRHETADPFGDLQRWLDRVRTAGIEVVASAAHGAKACYEGGFANHWIWSELRGDDPAAIMEGISAEGIRVDDPAFQLPYPTAHRIERADGAAIDLWSVSMSSLGIEHEACLIPVDGYWSDSGGDWKRSPDPMSKDLTHGRHQVLVHPWWWREPRRSTIVLSTARSGTKWLCERMRRGTSATVLHERLLNQHGSTTEPVAGLKRTAGDLVGLLDDADAITRLLETGLAGHGRTNRDVFEANVYLPHVDPELLRRDDVAIVHLHRDPAKVVRSILERGWYDPSGDRRHPRFAVEGWDVMDRVERACVYWAETNRHLVDQFPNAIRVAVEDLQEDPARLLSFITRLGFTPHAGPLGASDEPVDRTNEWRIPPVDAWSDRDRGVFLRHCGPVAAMLGRTLAVGEVKAGPTSTIDRNKARGGPGLERSARIEAGPTVRCAWGPAEPPRHDGLPCLVGHGGGGTAGLRHGSGWSGGRRWFNRRPPRHAVLEGAFEWAARGAGFAGRLFAVEVDRRGQVLRRVPLSRLEAGRREARFSIRLEPGAVAAHPVLLVDAADEAWSVQPLRLIWEFRSEPMVMPRVTSV